MGHTKAIGRRGRVLRRANERAQRRFHAAWDSGVWHDPYAKGTQLYLEAERLVRHIMGEPEPSSLDIRLHSLRTPRRDESDILAMYWNRGA